MLMIDDKLTFAFCPHCREDDIKILENKIRLISSILKKDINVVTFEDFEEEEKRIEEFDYHIIYANPDSAVKLTKKGYIPIGKLRNDNNHSICSVVSLQYNPKKDVLKIALINRKYFLLPLLFYKTNYKNFYLIFTKNYDEIIDLVRKGTADLGFIYSKISKEMKNDSNIKLSEDFCFPFPHFILIHPSLKHFKDSLVGIEEIEKVYPAEIESFINLFNQLEDLLHEWANHDIVEALKYSPIIGTIIYQEKIVFANEYAIKLLGYSENELYQMNNLDLIFDEDITEKIIENRKRRLSGEKFPTIYDIRFIKKDGNPVYVKCFTSTILFKGIYSGFILFYDISHQKRAEAIKLILKNINRTITHSLTEEEVYSEICKNLVEQLGLKFVWVGIFDDKGRRFPKFYHGKEEGLIEFFQKTEHICEKALKERDIVVLPDLRIVETNPVRKELLKRGIYSSCLIPILKNNNVVSTLSIYSNFPNFFSEDVIDLLKEIQRELSFAVERIDRIKHDIIIAEALKHSDTWILVTDENGEILYVNEAVERISGYKKEELIGKNPRIFKSGLNPPEFYKKMWDTILSGKIYNNIIPNRKKNGEIFHVDLKIIPVKLPENTLRFVAVAKDVTEKLMLSEKINKLKNYDALTELLNLNGFSSAVTFKLREAQAKGIIGVFILIDLSNMTKINKILGFSGGDKCLQIFAKKLKDSFKDTDIIARISADTFGLYILVENSIDIFYAYQKLSELNDFKFEIGDKKLNININAGIALSPKDGITFQSLYNKADITLTKAKNEGEGVIKFYDLNIENEVENQWNIANLVIKAFEQNLFVFYFQPYYYTDTLKVAGFEALVRIIDKDKIYYPNSFIDYLENSRYLSKFESRLINETIEKIKKWNMSISINISGKTFNNPDFILKIENIPEEVRDKITIEITERLFIEKPERAKDIISSIKKMKNSPKIAMDDFGTGYSSLVHIKDLSIDIIKIDIAFIRDMLKDRKSLAVVQTIIDLAKRLEKLTLAEGVETEQQLNILRYLGCDLVQGFLLSKPLSADAVESKIIKNDLTTS